MGARLYDPTFGRFTQVDPVEGGVENNYVYPADPVNKNDVSGKCPWCILALPILYEALETLSETPTGTLSRGFKSPEIPDIPVLLGVLMQKTSGLQHELCIPNIETRQVRRFA
ncbi:MAG TPA: RHS repeat-associated core domain-containing protein [Candidatus Saccharimonadia bacterium]